MTHTPPAPPRVGAAQIASEALARAASLAPDLEALVAPDGRITFAQLAEDVGKTAAGFATQGIGSGDRVALILGNSIRWIVCFLALARLGAVTVPVNTRLKSTEVSFILNDAGVRTAVMADEVLSSDFAAMLPEIRSEVPGLETVIMCGAAAAGTVPWDVVLAQQGPVPGDPAATDPLLIQYTSGTTAFPKAVPLSHRQMLTNGFVSGARLGLRTADRLHSARPFFHVAGTTLSILSCLQHRATLVTMERFDAGQALHLLEAERCTHFAGNGTMVALLLDHPDRPRTRLGLRGAWLAAPPDLLGRAAAELPVAEVVTGYGLSEASPNVGQSAWWEASELRISGLMRPQPDLDVRVGGKPLTESGEGEITVRGWSVMAGYRGRPAETTKVLSPEGWLSTGDLGRSDGMGRFAFVGRLKEMLRVGGENVAPAEVEAVLCQHPDVSLAEVVALPDTRLGEVPVAFCVGRADPDQLRAWAAERLASFKAPRHIWCLKEADDLGLTASGKASKAALSARAQALLGGVDA